MRHFRVVFGLGDFTNLGGDAVWNFIFFNTLNRASSNDHRVCRGRSHPKTSHTAPGAV
ncbi:hypothetical protein THIOKS11300007 [Thiocapsa sp. KS1]|nr:hypothetical protein THIOKS11300007 [Thiocapsa sp. KS1]